MAQTGVESAEMEQSRQTQVTFWEKMHLKHASFIPSPRIFIKFRFVILTIMLICI